MTISRTRLAHVNTALSAVGLDAVRAPLPQTGLTSNRKIPSSPTSATPPLFNIHVVSKDNPKITPADGKRYVGLSNSFPPPDEMNAEWTEKVRTDLNNDLSAGITRKYSSLSRQKQAF